MAHHTKGGDRGRLRKLGPARPMNYGFVIDNRKCIGCHACTTACKSEHEVPLGVNRTWVKYTETGAFPQTKRHFQVTRCNHCANPPCVAICPTGAMFQRKDGIVEFDSEICIGCKACMQACPYDAIYIDPESDTAAKCNYCAHRIEVGLEPACVIVCPEHAILSGDLDDPATEIARAVREHKLTVRKPEQGTRPKLFYIDVEPASVVPMAAAQSAAGLWSEMPRGGDWRKPFQADQDRSRRMHRADVESSPSPPNPLSPSGGEGAFRTANMAASLMARETYNVPHKVPWHWPVPAYLVTKAISAGTFMVAGAGVGLGLLPETPLFTTWASFIALLFALITTVLLIADLSQPKRFYYMLVKPQWKSWLTKGAFVLIGFTTVAGVSWLAYALGYPGVAKALIWPGVALGALTAVYTAFLFAQAEGRDLWQSKLLGPHLFVQAVMAGAATLMIGIQPGYEGSSGARGIVWTFVLACFVNLVMAWREVWTPHSGAEANAAAGLMRTGRHGRLLQMAWFTGAIAMPIASMGRTNCLAGVTGGLLALLGLLAYEWAFVMAPQEVPNN